MSAAGIGDLVREQGRALPDRVAILGAGGSALSYRELADRLDLWNGALVALGLTGAARIGLCLPAGSELAVALLAVSAFGTCAPLSPGTPVHRLVRDRVELGLDLIITTARRDEELRNAGVPAARLDSGGLPAGAPRVDPKPLQNNEIALLLRTSGTTGTPKVVPLSHGNLCASAANIRRSLALTAEDRCLDIMPLWHVHGFVAGLLASLAAGASVVCAPPFAAADFPALLKETGATWYTAAPALHRAILEAVPARPAHRLRFVRSSSARLQAGLAAELEATFGVPVLEAYGMTEAAHQIAANPLPPARRKPGSVGVPTGIRVAILGPAGAPLGTGDVGEIAIRDGSVFGGYEHDPASAFTDGWFRTGDLGRLDTDGYLFLSGRIREMINRGGQTIAPREVDETLLDHPDVTDAVAFGIPHPRLGEVVAAIVVARPGSGLTEAGLRAFARGRLDPASVPARIGLVEAIVRGASGKPRLAELREQLAKAQEPVEVAAGSARLAERLAADWSELLETGDIGLTDSLSELGSDSLLCTRLANRITATFGVRVPIDELLLADTVAEQAALVGDLLAAGPGAAR